MFIRVCQGRYFLAGTLLEMVALSGPLLGSVLLSLWEAVAVLSIMHPLSMLCGLIVTGYKGGVKSPNYIFRLPCAACLLSLFRLKANGVEVSIFCKGFNVCLRVY